MATVYLAIQENFEREVALKIMSPALSEDTNFSERFLREARIVSRLVHPHIVTVHDVGIENGHHYLSMEYIRGQDLKQALPGMSGDRIFRLMREVASALDYAGRKGYVHRDVKPENIMISAEDGHAVLMDFGIARAADSESTMTRTGTALGTPHYMSPEQARGDSIDGRSDLYSLGVLFYFMLTGKVPYEAESAVAIGIKHLTAPIPSLPKPLASYQPLINRLMAKKPEDRFQTGYDLIAVMGQFDPGPLNRWRPRIKKSGGLTSTEYTPVRSDQATALVSGAKMRATANRAKASGARLASISSAQQNAKRGAGDQLRETITIPQEDLRERMQAEKKSSPAVFYLFVVIGLTLAGGYFFRSEISRTAVYQELASALGIPVANQQSPAVSSLVTQRSVDASSRSMQDSLAVAIARAADPELKRLLINSRALAAQLQERPERTPELVKLYREILSIQPDHPQVTAIVNDMQQKALSAVAAQMDTGDADSAQQTLNNAVTWFPELQQDERYLTLTRRFDVITQLNELLPLAEKYLALDQLVQPADGNAKDIFEKILNLDPDNDIAKRGMQRIMERFLELANEASNRRDYQEVQTLVNQGLNIDPSYRPLLNLKTRAAGDSARDQKIASLLMQAQIMESEQKLFGEGQNAAGYYQTVLAIDPGQIDARQSLEQIKRRLFKQVDRLVNEKDYEKAIKLIENALMSLPDDNRLTLKLQELNTSKPAIDNVALSGQPIVDPNAGVPETVNADRTLHVAFHYQGLDPGATVLQAVLFDGARSVQIAAVPVMVLGGSGSTQFRVDRPIEGFTDGGYHLDILLSGKRIFTNSFVIAQ